MATNRWLLVLTASGFMAFGAGCELFPPEPPPPIRAPGAATELANIGGGSLGAAGGYVVGASPDSLARTDLQAAAVAASLQGETQPATVGDREVVSADLDEDGFITLDEIVAMHRAGLTDEAIVGKLGESGYVLGATRPQVVYLASCGVSATVGDYLQFPSARKGKVSE
jgi:hypothetical protein